MGVQVQEQNPLIGIDVNKQICLYCNNSNIERHISGMVHMICKLNGEGVNSFSFCNSYMELEVTNVCLFTR